MLKILALSLLIFCFTLCSLFLHVKQKTKFKNYKFRPFCNRLIKTNAFEHLAKAVIRDILEAAHDTNGSREQVQALLPLLSDVKKQGKRLVQQRKFYHFLLFPDAEKRLLAKVGTVCQVENFLKSLPRQKVIKQNTIPLSVFGKVGV